MFNNCLDAENEFEKCWQNPHYTAIQLDDVDVNKTLAYYSAQKPIHFTKQMLWDMEKKKSWNPGNYISYVVKEGSAQSWNKQPCHKTGGETFVRCSSQKKWLDPNVYEDIYEEVYVNENAKLITFLGVTTLPGKDGELHPSQPLFHVQHGVDETEDRPLNTWRIVHLTHEKDQQLISHFENMNEATILPGFIKAYVEKDLNISIKRM